MTSLKFDLSSFQQHINCETCGKPNPSKRCSQCRCTFYCSDKCQKKHWKIPDPKSLATHKVICTYRHQEALKMKDAKNVAAQEMEPLEPLNTSCSICLEEPIVKPVVLKECRHAFCSVCLMDWQKHRRRELNLHPSKFVCICPVCRQTLPKSTDSEALEKAKLYFAAGDMVDVSYKEADDPIMLKIVGDAVFHCEGRELPKKFPRFRNERQKHFYQLATDQLDRILLHDPNHILALQLKGEALRFVNPEEAIQAFEMALAVDQQGIENDEKLEAYVKQLSLVKGPEHTRLFAEMRAMAESMDFHLSTLGSGPYRKFWVEIYMAEAYEALGKYSKAYSIYNPMLKLILSLDAKECAKVDLYIMIAAYAGISRCFYVEEKYDLAKQTCQTILTKDRHIPGNHLVLAQSQMALGEMQAALTTLQQGILLEYEMPHAENRHRNMVCLERMSRIYAAMVRNKHKVK